MPCGFVRILSMTPFAYANRGKTTEVGPIPQLLTVSRMFAWGIVLRLLLDASFVLHIVEDYSYAGFHLNVGTTRYLESWLAYLVVLLAVPKYLRRPSDLLVLLLVFGMVAPASSLYALMGLDRRHFLLLNATIWIVLLVRTTPALSLAMIRRGPPVVIIFLFGMAIVTTAWMIQAGALSIFGSTKSTKHAGRCRPS